MLNQPIQDDVEARRAQLTPEDYEYLTISQLTQLGYKHSYKVLYSRIHGSGMSHYDAATKPKKLREDSVVSVDQEALKTPEDYECLKPTQLALVGCRLSRDQIMKRLQKGMTKYEAATTPKMTPGRSQKISAHVEAWKNLGNAMIASALANEQQSIFPFDKNATPERRLASMRWK